MATAPRLIASKLWRPPPQPKSSILSPARNPSQR